MPDPDMFDNESKAIPSEDDGGGGAAASAALSNLFNSEQGYGIELAAFPNPDAPVAGSGAATPAEGGAAAMDGQQDGERPLTLSSAEVPMSSGSPSALATGSTDPNAEHGHGQVRAKRPGTSRQHMLTRGGACEFCKRRKLKCTAEMPQCAACRRSNRECVYSQKKQRSRMKLLEDKVSELESRLAEKPRGGSVADDASSSSPAVVTGVHNANVGVPIALPPHPEGLFTAQHQQHQQQQQEAPSAGVELAFLGLAEHSSLTLADMSLTPGGKHNVEPDLMTLADAAAADTEGRMPWDSMEPQLIADEIVKAIIGHERGGVGEKICAHLIQIFVNTPDTRLMHWLISPSYLWARLTGRGGSQPHPSFLLALMPMLMPFSPSAKLSNTKTISVVADTVCVPSRALQQQALATLDPRVLDLVCGATLRSLALGAAGRFVDGWNENSTACSLLWATGLGKLGGVGEMFVPSSKRPADRAVRLEREHRLRLVRTKGQIVPPPSDAADVAERIRLFWSVWINDCLNGIGWNWPSDIALDEVTTPLPRDSYDTAEDLCDNTTLHDFLTERVHSSPSDGQFAARVKSMALAYEASRLLDRAPSIATPDVSGRLLRVSRRHMATMRAWTPTSAEDAKLTGAYNQDWMCMYLAILLIYSKEELDAPSPFEEMEARDKMIEAGLNMCRCVQAAIDAGDTELEGYDLLCTNHWFVVARAFHHLANRLESSEPVRAAELRERVRFLVEMTGKLCKTLKLNDVYYQMIFNVSMDQEVMLGEYRRPDNIDFEPPNRLGQF